jgi:hypothetical protein
MVIFAKPATKGCEYAAWFEVVELPPPPNSKK